MVLRGGFWVWPWYICGGLMSEALLSSHTVFCSQDLVNFESVDEILVFVKLLCEIRTKQKQT